MTNPKVEKLLTLVGDFSRADFLAAAAEMLAQASTVPDRLTARLHEDAKAHAREIAVDEVFEETIAPLGDDVGDLLGIAVTEILDQPTPERPKPTLPYALRPADREIAEATLDRPIDVAEAEALEACVRRCLEVSA